MIKKFNSFKFRSLLVLAFYLIASSNVLASSEKTNLLITQNLSQKLQNDLAVNSVEVKLNDVKEYNVSKYKIGLKGTATCSLNTGELAIQFDMKVNPVNQNVSDIKYDFIENSTAYAPTFSEEILMKELMKKISHDYKTDNIVIAIDTVENVGAGNDKNKFLGIGEVRIGDLVWNKIKFDVELDARTQETSKVVYKIEK